MMFTFAGTIAHFITDDWELIERLIDFRHLAINDHKGVHAAKAFVKSASARGGLNKMSNILYYIDCYLFARLHISAITMDNATTNDVLTRTLGRLLLQQYKIPFETKNAQIRCLAHVVNLTVQKILSTLDEADDPKKNDYFILNKFMEVHYNPDEDEDLLFGKVVRSGRRGGEGRIGTLGTQIYERVLQCYFRAGERKKVHLRSRSSCARWIQREDRCADGARWRGRRRSCRIDCACSKAGTCW